MKIIDFERKGNVIKLYLGDNDCNDYWGDDWDDFPYECNAGRVYDEFVQGYAYLYIDYAFNVFEPSDDWYYDGNSPFCKADFKKARNPILVITTSDEGYLRGPLDTESILIYFEQEFEPGAYYLDFEKKKFTCIS